LLDFGDAELEYVIDQNMTDSDPRPMLDLGYNLSVISMRSKTYVSSKLGAWAPTSGNSVNIDRLSDVVSSNVRTVRAVVTMIAEQFNPLFVHAYCPAAAERSAMLRLPFPFIDWMVYNADCVIPPEALPMVHSVERVGTGTLVILKKERLHLDRPEDLALVEAAEPIIRSYFPPPPPKANVPEHKSVQ
jgi:hypothetical protein